MFSDIAAPMEHGASSAPETRVRNARQPRIAKPVLQTPSAAQRFYALVRRGFEVAASLILFLVTSPLLVIAALAIKFSSSGPAFYTQARVGKNGRIFTIFKLRTMIDNCESLTGPRWCIPDDPRITWFGWILRRTHLDELPQLLNVLRGDMSLIGPRPERPEFVEELSRDIPGYSLRHTVLPGITGLAQVHLPPDTDTESVRRKLVYDMYYIRRFGPWLDLRLLACTALHAFAVPFRIAGAICFIPKADKVEQSLTKTSARATVASLDKAAA